MEPDLDHRSVYCFDPRDGALRRMADFEQPNGLAFSPDGRTLYVSDTSRSLNEIPGDQTGIQHKIEAFDVAADGTLANRRFFCHTDHGYPDGFKVDPRGWMWTRRPTVSTFTRPTAHGSATSHAGRLLQLRVWR